MLMYVHILWYKPVRSCEGCDEKFYWVTYTGQYMRTLQALRQELLDHPETCSFLQCGAPTAVAGIIKGRRS